MSIREIYQFPKVYKQVTAAVQLVALGHQRVTSEEYYWDNKRLWKKSDYYFIQYTLSGHGIFETCGKSWKVDTGKAFLVWIKQPMRYFFDGKTDGWEFIWLGLRGASGELLFREILDTFGPVVKLDESSPPIQAIHDLLGRSRKKSLEDLESVSTACYRFLLQLRSELSKSASGQIHNKVRWAIDHFVRHLQEPLDVTTLSRMCGCSREHFTRLFQQETGSSPGQYFTDFRLSEVRTLLRATDMNLREIAERTGFTDPNYLCRLFKKRFRQTPSGFRSG